MHTAASEYVFEKFHNWRGNRTNLRILDIGSLDINGTVRPLLERFSSKYVGIDMQEGPGVDIVTDARDFIESSQFDVVVSCEVFEHCAGWQKIIQNAHLNLTEGGLFIATMAGEGRQPHSGVHGNAPYEWEHYANIGEWELAQVLRRTFATYETSYVGKDHHPDLRCWAVKD